MSINYSKFKDFGWSCTRVRVVNGIDMRRGCSVLAAAGAGSMQPQLYCSCIPATTREALAQVALHAGQVSSFLSLQQLHK
jgi:hypothetical protein